MKKLKKILLLLLSFIMAFAVVNFTACDDSTNSDKNISGIDVVSTAGKMSSVKRNVKLIIPEGYNKDTPAVADFLYFFSEAMGFKPEMVNDDAVSMDKNNYYVAIGIHNKVLERLAKENNYNIATKEDITHFGVALKTFDNVTCIYGTDSVSDCNAVYEFLQYEFDFDYFAKDSFTIKNSPFAVWKNFNIKYKPLIDTFCPMVAYLTKDPVTIRRLRAVNYWGNVWIDGMYAHTYQFFVPKDEVIATHPEWYYNNGVDLCTTGGGVSGDELLDYLANAIENSLTRTLGDGRLYISVSQNDSFSFCSCPNCESIKESIMSQYDVNENVAWSYMNIDFTNKVVAKVKEWIAENQPGRDVTFVPFAYNATKYPPVKFDKDTGKYIPLIKADPSISVQYVINFVNYAVPYYEDSNIKAMMDGWSVVTDHICTWEYCTNFENFMTPMENLGSMYANFKWLSEHGATFITQQGTYACNASFYEELRGYVMCKLAWGEETDTDALIKKFIKYYYAEAGETMQELWDLERNNMAVAISRGASSRSGGMEMMQAKYWSNALLNRLENLIDKALEDIESLKTVNPDKYLALVWRINKERVGINYWQLTFYKDSYYDSIKRANDLAEMFAYYGIALNEAGTGYIAPTE